MRLDDKDFLFHRGKYDPVKAREYYLRTRHLKGRPRGSQAQSVGSRVPQTGSVAAPGMRPSRHQELLAQEAALKQRLDHLKTILSQLVDAAKKRSGIDDPPADSTSSPDPKETADRNERDKKSTPLTEKQKRDKREASKKQYEKEKGMSLSKDVQALQKQIQDIRAKIEQAVKDAREKSSRSNPQTASNGR